MFSRKTEGKYVKNPSSLFIIHVDSSLIIRVQFFAFVDKKTAKMERKNNVSLFETFYCKTEGILQKIAVVTYSKHILRHRLGISCTPLFFFVLRLFQRNYF